MSASTEKPDQLLDRPGKVREGEELSPEQRDRLGAFLDQHVEVGPETEDTESADELEVRQFPGGFSNLTYAVRFRGHQLVLRRPPFGAEELANAHDMGREYRVLTALAGHYPKVPRALARCEDRSVIGAPFYVMERVEGVILRAGMPREMTPEPETMAGIATSLIDTLIELHRVDVAAAGLSDFGRPGGYAERQVGGWSKRYRHARTDDVEDMETVASWLAAHLESFAGRTLAAPALSRPTLIHNDFKYDNLVLDPGEWTRVLAVLDWEMATLGDPRLDLGTSLAYWVDADDPPALRALRLSPTDLPGNPRRHQVFEAYAAGRDELDLDENDLVFGYVFGLFKIAVIVQQIYYRYRQGKTSDPRFAGLIDAVEAAATTARQAIELQRIDRLF